MYTDRLHLTSFSKESRCRRLYAVHNLQRDKCERPLFIPVYNTCTLL